MKAAVKQIFNGSLDQVAIGGAYNATKINIRTPLTLTAGSHTLAGSDIVVTSNQTVIGKIPRLNNGRVSALNQQRLIGGGLR